MLTRENYSAETQSRFELFQTSNRRRTKAEVMEGCAVKAQMWGSRIWSN